MQKSWGLKAKEVSDAGGGSIDTIRKLGKIGLSDEFLDKVEAGIKKARLKKESKAAG